MAIATVSAGMAPGHEIHQIGRLVGGEDLEANGWALAAGHDLLQDAELASVVVGVVVDLAEIDDLRTQDPVEQRFVIDFAGASGREHTLCERMGDACVRQSDAGRDPRQTERRDRDSASPGGNA